MVIMKDSKAKEDEPLEPTKPADEDEPEGVDENIEIIEEKPNTEIVENVQTGDKILICIAVMAIAGLVLILGKIGEQH